MARLVDRILDHLPGDIVTGAEIASLLTGSATRRHSQVKRALARCDLQRVRRDLFVLGKRYRRHGAVNAYELAQRIYGPSYVSFESALSFHGLIPEAVRAVSSASARRTREFRTPLGRFTYTHTPVRSFMVGVERIEEQGRAFLMATPLKALADYVYANRPRWRTGGAAFESLRIDRDDLVLRRAEIEALMELHPSARVLRFLAGLRREAAS